MEVSTNPSATVYSGETFGLQYFQATLVEHAAFVRERIEIPMGKEISAEQIAQLTTANGFYKSGDNLVTTFFWFF